MDGINVHREHVVFVKSIQFGGLPCYFGSYYILIIKLYEKKGICNNELDVAAMLDIVHTVHCPVILGYYLILRALVL